MNYRIALLLFSSLLIACVPKVETNSKNKSIRTEALDDSSRQIAKLFKFGNARPLNLSKVVRETGKHVIFGDVHLDPANFLNGRQGLSSPIGSNLVFSKFLNHVSNQNENVSAVTINGDVFDRKAIEALTEEQRAEAFLNFYKSILANFKGRSVSLFVNAGDHDFPKLIKKGMPNSDDVLDLKLGALFRKSLRSPQMLDDIDLNHSITLIGMNPRQPILYQPVRDSPPIAISHIAYDVTPTIRRQLGEQQMKFSPTLGAHPKDLRNVGDVFEGNVQRFASEGRTDVVRVSSDLHVPYGDRAFNIFNTGTASAPKKNRTTPFTYLQIENSKVEHKALYSADGEIKRYLNCIDDVVGAVGSLGIATWDPEIERANVNAETSADGC